MVDLSAYDPETIDKAFWLQEQIYQRGLEPVGFMRSARKRVSRDGAKTIADAIETELKR